MSRLAGDMKGFVVLGVYRSIVKKQNKEKKHCYGRWTLGENVFRAFVDVFFILIA